MNAPILILALAALSIFPCRAEPGQGLNRAAGNIYKIDLENQSFELLKETEYDPKTDLGKSRFTVHWTDQTTITKVGERTHFGDIKGPVIADFHGIDDKSAQAMKEGNPFEARVAILHVGAKDATGPEEGHRKIVSWFTPEPGPLPGAEPSRSMAAACRC